MSHKKQAPIASPLPETQAGDRLPRQPFVEPKLTWVEPALRQQGTLTAAAQSGGFFGSFSP